MTLCRSTWVGLALVVLGAAGSPAAAVTLQGRVVRVVDGDTIAVRSRGFETTVRLLGIDTPETRSPGIVQCFGPAASARTRRLLPRGVRVRLVTDPTQDTRDRYGRLLAYVYRAGRSTSVNLALVATGHAKVYVFDRDQPFRHARSYLRAQARARAARRGLWGPPCFGNTARPDPSARPSPPPSASPSGSCDPNYTGCVPPYPPDVDCADVAGPVRVVGGDPHRLDGDGDGIACE
jgi:micrococcal nuclease